MLFPRLFSNEKKKLYKSFTGWHDPLLIVLYMPAAILKCNVSAATQNPKPTHIKRLFTIDANKITVKLNQLAQINPLICVGSLINQQ